MIVRRPEHGPRPRVEVKPPPGGAVAICPGRWLGQMATEERAPRRTPSYPRLQHQGVHGGCTGGVRMSPPDFGKEMAA
jgi:hypothetical protein